MAQEELFLSFHDHLPAEMIYERQLLIGRLGTGREHVHSASPGWRDMEELL